MARSKHGLCEPKEGLKDVFSCDIWRSEKEPLVLEIPGGGLG